MKMFIFGMATFFPMLGGLTLGLLAVLGYGDLIKPFIFSHPIAAALLVLVLAMAAGFAGPLFMWVSKKIAP